MVADTKAANKARLRDLAKKHGIDLDRVKDRQDEIDLETGKGISADGSFPDLLLVRPPKEILRELRQ
jgi:4-hydroxy-3-methylbut-2-enyl diphosphate reductase IspH